MPLAYHVHKVYGNTVNIWNDMAWNVSNVKARPPGYWLSWLKVFNIFLSLSSSLKQATTASFQILTHHSNSIPISFVMKLKCH